MFEYENWKENKHEHLSKLPEVAVSFDMGWQKRSSGRTYDSVSGHGMVIGGKTCKIIDGIVLSKRCSVPGCKKPDES